MIRTILIATLILVAACGDPEPAEDPVGRARLLAADGQHESALAALREAMREDPEDPELRLLVAEVYLELEQGTLALTALQQAVDRGLSPSDTLLPLGRALALERRWGDLIALELPNDLGIVERVHVLALQAEAKSKSSTSAESHDDEVARAFIGLFAVIEANQDNAEVAAIGDSLQKRRLDRTDIERAWRHFMCARQHQESVSWAPLISTGQRVLTVGPEQDIKTIADAASRASDGDTVEIESGTYTGGVAIWPQNDLVVRGLGERPRIEADGRSVEDRDVWLFTGNNIVVENVEISGARSPWKNGAAIRHVGSGLTLRHVFLHDNENGVLTSNRHPDTNRILIEFSEFANNGDGEGFAHNLYIGRSRHLELRYSFSHSSSGGHLVKSRARENHISYNRLSDEQTGRSSYVIDIAEGGTAYIVGNVIEQGAATINHGMISFAGESHDHPDNRLYIVNNSIYNRDFKGILVRNHASLDVQMVNNLMGGAPATKTDTVGTSIGNLTQPGHGMVDPRNYNFALDAGAPAIDSGVDFEIRPSKEYVHPVQWRDRQDVWKLDVGAFERCGID